MSKLTEARLAVWQAINHWSWPEEFEWAKKYESDAHTAEMMLRGPAPHQLPAIALAWANLTVEEVANLIQHQISPLQISMWFAADQLSVAEEISDQILKCICQSAPEGSSVTYIRQAIGYAPRPLGPMTLKAVKLGESDVMAWRLDAAIGLRISTDFYHAGS